uniref:AAA domain-containing protein n=1 Tax=Parastrongyloides trichosuri TaxID=131310 RepID=A0A0N4ZMC7_PARTI
MPRLRSALSFENEHGITPESSPIKEKKKPRKRKIIDSDDEDEVKTTANEVKKKKKLSNIEDKISDNDNEEDLGAIKRSVRGIKEKKKPEPKSKKKGPIVDTKQTKLEFFLNNTKTSDKKDKKDEKERKDTPVKKTISATDYFSKLTVSSLPPIDEKNEELLSLSSGSDVPMSCESFHSSPVESKKKDIIEKKPQTPKKNVVEKGKSSVKPKTELTKEVNKKRYQKDDVSPVPKKKSPVKPRQPSPPPKGPQDMLWVDKYVPKTIKELIGQQTDKSPTYKLLNWLKSWSKNNLGVGGTVKKVKPTGMQAKSDGDAFKAALLSGPPGIGKTTCATLVCKELGLKYIQLNASDSRGKKILQEKVAECLKSRDITSFFKVKDDKKKSECEQVLIMDEVDGMSGSDDRAGISELITMIKHSKIPIICICNDRFSRKLSSLANHCFDLRFAKPTSNQVRGRLMAIASKEGIKIPADKMLQVAETSNLDIRQSIYNLQLLKCGGDTSKLTAKDTAVNIFDAAKKILDPRTPMYERTRLYFSDYSIMPLFVQENYINIEPTKMNKAQTLRALAKSAEVLSYVDVMDNQIRKNQNWGLLNDQCTFAAILVPGYMQGYLNGQLAFPTHLGKVSQINKRYRMAKQLTFHMSTKLSIDITSLVIDVLPVLRRQLAEPLIKKQNDGIPEVIDLYNHYALNKEDQEFIIELTDWSNEEEIEKSIPSKVKAAFTRALTKENRMLPYADVENDVMKVTKGKKTSKKELIKKRNDEDESSDSESVSDGNVDELTDELIDVY